MIHTLPWSTDKDIVLWWPVPWIGVGYVVGIALALFAVSLVPVVGGLLSWMPWPLIYVLIPIWTVMLGMKIKVDGRYPHKWLWSAISFYVGQVWRQVRGWVVTYCRRAQTARRTRVAFDEMAPDLHRGRIHGPASVVFTVPVKQRGQLWATHSVVYGAEDGTPGRYEVSTKLDVKP